MTVSAALVLLCCILCYVGQGFGNKMFSLRYPGSAADAAPVFASVTGLICGLSTFFYNGCAYHPGSVSLLFGMVNGLVLFLFNVSAIQAARLGPYPFQTLISTLGNILLPVLFAMLFYGEKIDARHLIGVMVMLSAFVVFNLGGFKKEGLSKKFLFWACLLMLMNGVYGILLDAHSRRMDGLERNELIMTTFMTSAGLSILYLLFRKKGKILPAYHTGTGAALFMLMSGVCAAVAVNLLMLALTLAPVYVVYPIDNGGVLLGNIVLSVLVLKEKLNRNKIIGILMVLCAFFLIAG